MNPGILTLTTDFGPGGAYVAAMKGVLLGLAPGTQIVDVSHTVSPQNVLEGAFVLAAIVDCFPADTVHLAVIDPGVGTERKLIAARLADQWFVLPDNGLITGVAQSHPPQGIWEITNPAIRRPVVSDTFHGRDILAPAAGYLLRGGAPEALGNPISRFIRLRNFYPTPDSGDHVGEVIFRDTFGNLITNLNAAYFADTSPQDWIVEIAGQRIEGLSRTYGEKSTGSLIALVGSSGWVEVAVVNGDAARHLTAGAGTTVWFRRRASHSP
jgi:S-adenosylmethionine hydrolase